MKVWSTKSGYTITRILSGRSNAFLLSDSAVNILIDTGPGRSRLQLKRRLKDLNLTKIDYLILTHTHYDHAENAAILKKEFGATVIVNESEKDFLKTGNATISSGTNFITSFLVKMLTPLLSVRFRYESCDPDILVDQYLDLKNYGINGYIMHTPGHSPGSQCVIIDDEIALVGDTMFGIFPGSILPPFAENKEDVIRNWGKLIKTNCKLFIPSHGSENRSDLVKRQYFKASNSKKNQN